MISKQKKFTVILFILSLAFLSFSTPSSVQAAQLHSFSINNKGKYFIYYRDGLDANTVKAFRNEIIKIIPFLEKWAGISFDKLEIDIVPDSFDDYEVVYRGTDTWKLHQRFIPTKERYSGIYAEAASGYKEIIIKESGLGAIYHELSHLAEYPFFGYDHIFSEGQANNGGLFISKALGVFIDYAPLYERYNQLSPKERKVYNVIYNALEPEKNINSLMYVVGTNFIGKILEKTEVKDLSAFYMNMRNDFSDVVDKYPKSDSYFSFISTTGQEIFLASYGFMDFNSVAGQEVVQCEMIKTYGEKVTPVFAESGFPVAKNCDAKIRSFKEEKLQEADDRMETIKDGTVTAYKRSDLTATEKDQWIGSEKKTGSSGSLPWTWTVNIIIFVITVVAGAVYFFFKKRKNRINRN